MPMYQYRCRECGHELEARQSFHDDPLTECPNCGAETGLFRVIQAAGVVFKGSGFYINDSKGDKTSLTKPTKSDASETTSTDTADTKSENSDTKPEKKTEPAKAEKEKPKKESSSSKPPKEKSA